MEKNLIVIEAEKMELEPEAKKNLLDNFTNYFEQAELLQQESKLIKIKDETQLEEMDKARGIRLKLKTVRTDVEKTRKKLKEDSLRKGKAIDGIANVIKYLIEPTEKYLKDQEDFIKIKQEKVLIELQNKRQMELSKYLENIDCFDLKTMNEDAYQILLKGSIDKYNQIKEAEKKAEQERIEKVEAEKAEQERIKKENEKLKKEAEEREKREKLRKEKIEKEQAEAEAENQAKLKAANEEAEKIRQELKRKEEAEAKVKAEAEAKKQAELKAQKEKELAPDKEKLNNLAIEIVNLKMPEVKNEKAKEIINGVIDLLNKTSNYIKKEIINL